MNACVNACTNADMNTDLPDAFAFAVTVAACMTLVLVDHATPAALTEYAAALTGLYTAWHNRPRP
ncbi:hypothetical protein [Streptomyces cinnamoneus]|uniref:Uncharacterized protein n=1 Tax=Streptomyces cinnamoneus TaxID=53446 RepID=A0A918WRH1_STRCJ|nr:hypothetical protein [Streptomyces cinnamoneus]GHC67947.1 hypothetical protein GCM10010507_52720 [Streptomyces cinnamoneus]